MFFRLVTSVEQRKILSSHEESNLRPSDLRSYALPLSHKDSSVSGVYYGVLMARVLSKTLRYRHCWSYQYAGRVSLELRNRPRSPKSLCGSVVEHRNANPKVWGSIPHGDSEFFLCPTLVTRRKNIFLNSSSSSKLTISTFLSSSFSLSKGPTLKSEIHLNSSWWRLYCFQ